MDKHTTTTCICGFWRGGDRRVEKRKDSLFPRLEEGGRCLVQQAVGELYLTVERRKRGLKVGIRIYKRGDCKMDTNSLVQTWALSLMGSGRKSFGKW
jgi:hypothetical protein